MLSQLYLKMIGLGCDGHSLKSEIFSMDTHANMHAWYSEVKVTLLSPIKHNCPKEIPNY